MDTELALTGRKSLGLIALSSEVGILAPAQWISAAGQGIPFQRDTLPGIGGIRIARPAEDA